MRGTLQDELRIINRGAICQWRFHFDRKIRIVPRKVSTILSRPCRVEAARMFMGEPGHMALWRKFSFSIRESILIGGVHRRMARDPVRHEFVIRPLHAGQVAASGKGACVKFERWKRGFYDKSSSISWVQFYCRSGVFIRTWAAQREIRSHSAPISVGDTTLAPGDYTIVVDGSEATFEQGHKVVRKRFSCAVKEVAKSIPLTGIVYANAASPKSGSRTIAVITFAPITTSTRPNLLQLLLETAN